MNHDWLAVLDGESPWCVHVGDCYELLKQLPDESVDSLVTDPPAAISFMGKAWDSFEDRGAFVNFLAERFRECLRVMKPGAHGLVWALPRTSHWTAWALEDAGFEVTDVVHHLFGKGFPKGKLRSLKPLAEHWILVRKPFTGTIKRCVETYGTGGLNIDDCRITTDDKLTRKLGKTTVSPSGWVSANRSEIAGKDGGRWPSNVALSHGEECDGTCEPGCPVAELDRQSGLSKSSSGKPRGSTKPGAGWGMTKTGAEYDDAGGASRFFYVAKPTRKEKEAGLDHLPAVGRKEIYGDGLNSATKVRTAEQEERGVNRGGVSNDHPTVKSITLLRYLVKLITPADGVVLDIFAGTGTTGAAAVLERRSFIGFEQNEHFCEIAEARVQYWYKHA